LSPYDVSFAPDSANNDISPNAPRRSLRKHDPI
jgi:hypothetical protein